MTVEVFNPYGAMKAANLRDLGLDEMYPFRPGEVEGR